MQLKNYMELAVNHYLPNVLKTFNGICTCKKCILDIKALALNNLKPQYIVTDVGEAYSKLNEMNIQFEADVMKALVDAISKVSQNPRH